MDFRIHEDARNEWERLCARLGESEARRWYAGLCAWVRKHDGEPPNAVADEAASPVVYWLLFGEAGAQYTLRDVPLELRGWWDVSRRVARTLGRRTRLVLFVGFDEPWRPAPTPV